MFSFFDKTAIDRPDPPERNNGGNNVANNHEKMEEKLSFLEGEVGKLRSYVEKFMVEQEQSPSANFVGSSELSVAKTKKNDKKKNKKRGNKKKRKGEDNKATSNLFDFSFIYLFLMDGNFFKLIMLMVTFALLLTMSFSLDIGEGGIVIQGGYPSLLRKSVRQSSASRAAADGSRGPPENSVRGGDIRQRLPSEKKDSVHPADIRIRQRMLQETSAPPTAGTTTSMGNSDIDSEDIPSYDDSLSYSNGLSSNIAFSSTPPTTSEGDVNLYYLDWTNGSACNNDPTQRPSNYQFVEFPTAMECCSFWWPSNVEDCMAKSSSSPPQTSPVSGDNEDVPPSSNSVPESSLNDADDSQTSTNPSESARPTPLSSTANPSNLDNLESKGSTSLPSFPPTSKLDCVSDLENCGWEHLNQVNYQGLISVTEDGTPCVNWNTQGHPDLEGNYCRNPDNDIRAWCFTIDDWGYCDVPYCCEDPPTSPPTTSPSISLSPTMSSRPSSSPTISFPPTTSSRPTFLGILFKEGSTFSKKGNRKVCAWDRCPSEIFYWEVDHPSCSCVQGLQSCPTDSEQPTTIVYFNMARLVPVYTTSIRYQLLALDQDATTLKFGQGKDSLSGKPCYGDPLRGGFAIDLEGTGYVFAEGTNIQLYGWSAGMHIKLNGQEIYNNWDMVGREGMHINTNQMIPAGGVKLEVFCGGSPGSCSANIFVMSETSSPTSTPSMSISPTSSCRLAVNKCFIDRDELKEAVDQYIEEDCDVDEKKCEVGKEYGWPINSWDVSFVTSMEWIFSSEQTSTFNGNVSAWDVSRVTSMEGMFNYARDFNGDVSAWDVSRVTIMDRMFEHASAFNGDVSTWQVSRVTSMEMMFSNAVHFNGNVSGWDVSRVISMVGMFEDDYVFNGDLSGWDVSSVTSMERMFSDAYAFNGDVSAWDVSHVIEMQHMFHSSSSFNGNVSTWDVSRVTNMAQMFYRAPFNGDVSGWDVSRVTNMARMFDECARFNGDVSAWDVSRVTSMDRMFHNALSFNGDVSGWDVSRVTSIERMFSLASAFNQNLCPWSKMFQYSNTIDSFVQSGCLFERDPDSRFEGPFCASSCQTITSLWKRSRESCDISETGQKRNTLVFPASPENVDASSGAEHSGVDELDVFQGGRDALKLRLTSPLTTSSDCLCEYIGDPSYTGYIAKPSTNCNEYIQCFEGCMVQAFACPEDMIFDSNLQSCNWVSESSTAVCDSNSLLDADNDCRCEYSMTECKRSLQDLLTESISPWELPIECEYADNGCVSGDTLFVMHKAEACEFIKGACEGGNSQSCFDKATHCCHLNDYCSCKEIEEACNRGSIGSCHFAVDQCCDGDTECRCKSLKNSCDASLESFLSDEELPKDCVDAEEACCEDCWPFNELEGHKIESCQCSCNFWDQFCMTYPGPACDYYARRCCGSPSSGTYNGKCYCEVDEYVDQNLGYKLTHTESCEDADAAEFVTTLEDEKGLLHDIYKALGGVKWLNSSDWLDNVTDHCEWHGITCNSARVISEIDLSSNNVFGTLNSSRFFSNMYKLKSLKLANNKLKGTIDFNSFYHLQDFEYIDISQNNLHGKVDALLSPAIKYIDMSRNKFSSISPFKLFKRSQQSLEVLDLSHNCIHQEITEVLENIPRNLKEFLVTGNHIHGSLPIPLPILDSLERFIAKENNMRGQIPDMSRSFQQIKELDLSNQTQTGDGGFEGKIPSGWAKLLDLAALDLSTNKLTGAIPTDIGILPQLQTLIVSNNELTHIPSELGNFAVNFKEFDVSNNALIGKIPSELRSLDGCKIMLSGNELMEPPAPLDLCYDFTDFDLKDVPKWCPPERNILKQFFESTMGGDWIENINWTDQYVDHCNWQGVDCDDSVVTGLNLSNNGLSGQLMSEISELNAIEILDLSDNDIKGLIPPEIGELGNLTHLRLSFNSFREKIPTELNNLHHLELLHLHGNRLYGEMPTLNTTHLVTRSSFIADCGIPSDFYIALNCTECTICCNSNGDCHSTEKNSLEKVKLQGFADFVDFIAVFAASLVGFSFIVGIASSLHDRYWKNSSPSSETEDHVFVKDKKYALYSIGVDSVYSFIFSKYKIAQAFAVFVGAFQVWALFFFVSAAVKDFNDEKSDFVYSWKCPRNSLECSDESDLQWQGWLISSILMAAHLLKDIINGVKLLLFCGKRRHHFSSKIRYFWGGLFLTWISAFALYASVVYNYAIARSITDIIANAVIIIFVIDVDEYLHKGILAAKSFWVYHATGDEEIDSLERRVRKLHDTNSSLETRVHELSQQNKNLTATVCELSDNVTNLSSGALRDRDRLDALEQMIRLHGLDTT